MAVIKTFLNAQICLLNKHLPRSGQDLKVIYFKQNIDLILQYVYEIDS